MAIITMIISSTQALPISVFVNNKQDRPGSFKNMRANKYPKIRVKFHYRHFKQTSNITEHYGFKAPFVGRLPKQVQSTRYFGLCLYPVKGAVVMIKTSCTSISSRIISKALALFIAASVSDTGGSTPSHIQSRRASKPGLCHIPPSILTTTRPCSRALLQTS